MPRPSRRIEHELRDRFGALRELHSPRELLLFARVTAFAAAVPLLLRLPLPRMAALVTRPARVPLRRPADIQRLARMIELAPRVGRPIVRTGCLTRGLTLFWFMRRLGLEVELRFGLELDRPQAVDGHCWLTLEGQPFLEPVDPRGRFAELYRLPLAG